MRLFDLVFIVALLATVVTLCIAGTRAVRGHRAEAIALIRRLGLGAALYFTILLLASAFTPQRYLAVADNECSDDWCIAVASVQRGGAGDRTEYDVMFRLSSRARRIAQRERFVSPYLLDDERRAHFPVADTRDVPFDTLLQPGDSVLARRHFAVPAGTKILGVVVTRAGAGRVPGCCIIGDENSLFHRRTIIRFADRAVQQRPGIM